MGPGDFSNTSHMCQPHDGRCSALLVLLERKGWAERDASNLLECVELEDYRMATVIGFTVISRFRENYFWNLLSGTQILEHILLSISIEFYGIFWSPLRREKTAA